MGISSGVSGMDRGDDIQLNILVVDDKPFMRNITGRVLQNCGCRQVSFAESGPEALTLIGSAAPPIDVVFCDLVMPDMDGVEVVRHVLTLPHVPAFVFVSGADEALLNGAMATARARGLIVLGAIEKPLNVEVVREHLEKFKPPRLRQSLAAVFVPTPEELEGALEQDRILLYYQPKYNRRMRLVEGVEALARWHHPEHGMILPGHFVPLAEEIGMIEALTDRALSLALRQSAEWNKAGLHTKISVNISAQLLKDLDLPDRMLRDTLHFGVAPQQIVLEITESGLCKDTGNALEILSRLHMKGFTLSIDDFGTGYSSMDQLRRIPFSELKIDRAFVEGAARNKKTKAILQSSVALGRSLSLTLVAEGAESEEDLALLEEVGVDIVQGFVIARPMPAKQVAHWISSHGPQH